SYCTKNVNNVKPNPVNPPIIQPFDLLLAPETTPPINNETIPMASVTHDKVGSLNEENRRSNARIRLATKINPKMMIQQYNNPINDRLRIYFPPMIVLLSSLYSHVKNIDEQIFVSFL